MFVLILTSFRTMDKENTTFWVTRPSCKQKFGVSAVIVFKY